MAKIVCAALVAIVGICVIPEGLGFLGGGSVDPRCYLQTCNISMTTLMNTVTIQNNINGSESGVAAAISDSEARVKTNVTTEVVTAGQAIGSNVQASTDMITMAISNMQAEIVADISSQCAEGFKLGQAAFIRVVLDIYSGIQNPEWSITQGAPEFDPVFTEVQLSPSTQIPALAGYRGFTVTVTYTDGTAVVYTYGLGQQANTTLETLLLSSSGGVLGSTVESIVTAAVNGQAPPDLGFMGPLTPESLPNFNPSCTMGSPCVAPNYLPSDWTSNSLTQITNNCYNYAINIPTTNPSSTFPRPGGSGTTLTGEAIRNDNVQEGMEDFEDPAAGVFPVTTNCLTALVIMEGLDFHYYRLDDDGTWSSKLGAHAPTNLDNDGNTITDPRTANIGPYQFVRFLGYCPYRFIGFT